MSLDTERLDVLAQAIVDGAPIDWDALLASGPVVDGVRLGDLRALSAAAAREGELQAGDTWGGLVLQEEVGRGTYGVVYRAWDPSLEREVALKLFRPAVGSRGGAERAVREGRLLAKVRHANVVAVYGADERDGRVGLWTEFIKGKTLRDVVREQGPMSAEEAARVGADLCRALAAVHAAGIVHGDIKAQNVMREVGGRIVLMDFGAGELALSKSAGGPIIGTPAYLAPEVLEGGAPSFASDVYALGVLLFFLSSGELPVDASSITGLREKHTAHQRARLRDRRPDLPQSIVDVIERALDPVPGARPATVGELGGFCSITPDPVANSNSKKPGEAHASPGFGLSANLKRSYFFTGAFTHGLVFASNAFFASFRTSPALHGLFASFAASFGASAFMASAFGASFAGAAGLAGAVCFGVSFAEVACADTATDATAVANTTTAIFRTFFISKYSN